MIDGGLRRCFHKAIPAFWTAIETGAVTMGVPDSFYMFQENINGFIEYKRTKAFAIKFQPEQIGWIDRYSRYGGRVWVAIRQMRDAGPRTVHLDNLFMVHGENVKILNRQGLKAFLTKEHILKLEKPGHSIIWRNADRSITAQAWSGGSTCWDWDTIEKMLKR